MLIHIWNEHPNMQANKLKCKVSSACLTLNQCTKHEVYASRNKILLGHKSDVLKEQVLRYKAKVQNPKYLN